MGLDPGLLGPVEREARFFLDPFHWLGLIEGGLAPDDASAWIAESIKTAGDMLTDCDHEAFQDWVYDETHAAAIARAESTGDLGLYTRSIEGGKEWVRQLYEDYNPSPFDAASAAWVDGRCDHRHDGEAIRRKLIGADWAEVTSVAGGLPVLLSDPFNSSKNGVGPAPDRYRHYSNVQAARWINEHWTEERMPPLGKALESGAVGPELLVRSMSASGFANHLRVVRSRRVADWLVRPNNADRRRYVVQRNRKSGVPEALVEDIVSELARADGGPKRLAVRRHLDRSGFKMPGDLRRRD